MTKKMKLLAAVGGLSVAGLLGAARSAQADTLEIALQEAGVNGGAITVVAVTPGTVLSDLLENYGDFTVNVNSASAVNGPGLSDVINSALSVINNSGTTKTLKIYISADNFTLPSGTLLNVESGLGGSMVAGSSLGMTGLFQAFADKNNNLLGLADFTNGPQNGTQTLNTYDTGSAFGVFTRLGTPYSLTGEITLTLSGGGNAGFQDHIDVTPAPLPATASMGLGLFGVIGAVGGLNALRRRRAAAL